MGEPVSDDRTGTLIGKTHARLKNNIITGRYRPGEKLRIEHLKRDYGVSGGTLREALTMLFAEGLVVSEGQRGFRVKPVSAADLIDLNRIRIYLEKDAIRQAIAHGDEEWEGSVVSAYHLLNRATKALVADLEDTALFEEWERKHREFHTVLFAATPSEWTRYFLTIAYLQCERYRYMFHALIEEKYADHRPVRNIEAEHAEILEAVLARDADKAATSLEQHLLLTLDEWVEHFEKVGAFAPEQVAPPPVRKKAGRKAKRVAHPAPQRARQTKRKR